MIHLGDYASKSDAQAQLQLMRKKAAAVLDGKTAQTVVIDKKGTITYRARFTGFDEGSAKAACKAIKKSKAACSVQASDLKQEFLGFVDLGGKIVRAAEIRMRRLHQAPVRGADIVRPCPFLQAENRQRFGLRHLLRA